MTNKKLFSIFLVVLFLLPTFVTPVAATVLPVNSTNGVDSSEPRIAQFSGDETFFDIPALTNVSDSTAWINNLLGLALTDDESDEADAFGDKFLRILKGQMDLGESAGYIAIMLVIVSSLMGIAQAKFPDYMDWNGASKDTYEEYSYSQVYNTISSLGNREKNPDNWWIFTTAMIVQAIMYVPLVLNLYKKIQVLDTNLEEAGIVENSMYAEITAISFLIGSIGMVLLAIFPENIGTLHDLSAIVCFGGYIFGLIAMGLMFVADDPANGGTGTYEEVRPTVDVFYGIAVTELVLLGVTTLIREVLDLDRDEKEGWAILTNWPLHEWLLFTVLQIGLPLLTISLNQVETI